MVQLCSRDFNVGGADKEVDANMNLVRSMRLDPTMYFSNMKNQMMITLRLLLGQRMFMGLKVDFIFTILC